MARYKVLIADYEPRSIKKTEEILLNNFDCEIKVAHNGIVAIELFHQFQPDLVLLEAMISKKHGFEVCLDMKNSPHGKKTPVIITTHVYKGIKYRNQAVHIYKCDEYLEKPCSDETIVETIKKFIPLSEEKAVASKKLEEKKASDSKEEKQQVAAEKKASKMPEDIEREIASKVDEVLTLFAGKDFFSASEKKEEATEKEKKSLKGSQEENADISLFVDSSIKTKTETPVIETKETSVPAINAGEAAQIEKAEKAADLEETYRPRMQESHAEHEKVPPEISSEAPIKYRSINFKMAVISISALVFLGILIVIFPFIKGKSGEEKIVKPVNQTAAQKKSDDTSSVPPSEISGPITEAPKSTSPDQKTQQAVKRELQNEKQSHGTQITATIKSPALPPINEKVEQQRLYSEKINTLESSAPALKEQRPPDDQAAAKASPTASTASQKNDRPSSEGAVSRNDQAPFIPENAPVAKESSVKTSAEPLQQETQPATKISEGAIIEYTELDKEPGFLAHEMPKYPLLAKLKSIEGDITLKVLIGINGHVQEVKIVKGLEKSLDELAVNAARTWVYRPPTKSGIRVMTWKTEIVGFNTKPEK